MMGGYYNHDNVAWANAVWAIFIGTLGICHGWFYKPTFKVMRIDRVRIYLSCLWLGGWHTKIEIKLPSAKARAGLSLAISIMVRQ